jgi:hypothetical protein
MSEYKKVVEIDGLTNQVTERQMTEAEVQALNDSNQELSNLKILEEAKANARTSALAKLAALGLTEAEIASL